jgi:hypothetical protein
MRMMSSCFRRGVHSPGTTNCNASIQKGRDCGWTLLSATKGDYSLDCPGSRLRFARVGHLTGRLSGEPLPAVCNSGCPPSWGFDAGNTRSPTLDTTGLAEQRKSAAMRAKVSRSGRRPVPESGQSKNPVSVRRFSCWNSVQAEHGLRPRAKEVGDVGPQDTGSLAARTRTAFTLLGDGDYG